MAKIKRTITTERESKTFDQLEARRRWLGATKAQVAGLINISVRTYTTWVTVGTTPKNVERIRTALLEYAKENKL